MLAVPALNECLLDLALQRSIAGFQQALKRTLGLFNLSAWAIIFPPSSAGAGGRPVLMAHGIRSTESPLLARASKNGLDSIFPSQSIDDNLLGQFAQEINPNPASRLRIFRAKRDKGGDFILFCFRAPSAPDFSAEEMGIVARVGQLLDRCFLALSEDQEHEFEAGLFRLIGNLHPEGLCVMDSRLRVLFENRRFKELMHVWNHGVGALQSLSLPRQSELADVWKEAFERAFQAFRQVKFPPVNGRMAVSQGPSSTLRKTLDTESWIEGAVRYLAFQSALGVRPYLIITCAFHRQQPTASSVSLGRIVARHGFSRREAELAELILRGNSAREIADRLKIALPTVKTHIRNILHKTGAKTRLQFVGLCRKAEASGG